MHKLTDNFYREEFEKGEAMPEECLPTFAALCQGTLEPTRAHFGRGISVTSGYRSPAGNAEAHGQPNSEHIATADHCAADWYMEGQDMREVFDWMRAQPGLNFHQLILEHGHNGDVIHTSYNRLIPGIRSAKEGATANQTAYADWPHAPFEAQPWPA